MIIADEYCEVPMHICKYDNKIAGPSLTKSHANRSTCKYLHLTSFFLIAVIIADECCEAHGHGSEEYDNVFIDRLRNRFLALHSSLFFFFPKENIFKVYSQNFLLAMDFYFNIFCFSIMSLHLLFSWRLSL